MACSSVARGGAGGGSSPPIGLWSMQNRMVSVLLRPILCKKWKIAPSHSKTAPLKRLNLRNWTKYQSQFWWRPFFFFFFFGDHLILGGKITPNFGEDLFFFFGDHLILGGKKRFNFRAFQDISSQFSEKPSETDSRSMKIRVKVVCTLLTLSK